MGLFLNDSKAETIVLLCLTTLYEAFKRKLIEILWILGCGKWGNFRIHRLGFGSGESNSKNEFANTKIYAFVKTVNNISAIKGFHKNWYLKYTTEYV